MKNLIILIIIRIIITSFSACSSQNLEEKRKEIFSNMRVYYTQDPITKLCFATTYDKNIYNTITCVPCDSLKYVKIYQMKSYLINFDKMIKQFGFIKDLNDKEAIQRVKTYYNK